MGGREGGPHRARVQRRAPDVHAVVDARQHEVGPGAETAHAGEDDGQGRRPVDAVGGDPGQPVDLEGLVVDAVARVDGADGGSGAAVVDHGGDHHDLVVGAGGRPGPGRAMPGARTPSSLVTRMRTVVPPRGQPWRRRCRLRQLPYRCPFPERHRRHRSTPGGGRAVHPHAITIERLEAPHARSHPMTGRVARGRAARASATDASTWSSPRSGATLRSYTVDGVARHRRIRCHRHVQRRARPGARPVAQPAGRRPLLDRRAHRPRRVGRTRTPQRHPRAGALAALAPAIAGPERRRSRLHPLRPARLSVATRVRARVPAGPRGVGRHRRGDQRRRGSGPVRPGLPSLSHARHPHRRRRPPDPPRPALPGHRRAGPADGRHHRGRERARLHLRAPDRTHPARHRLHRPPARRRTVSPGSSSTTPRPGAAPRCGWTSTSATSWPIRPTPSSRRAGAGNRSPSSP